MDISGIEPDDGYKAVFYSDLGLTQEYDISKPIEGEVTLYVSFVKLEFDGTNTTVSQDKKTFTVAPFYAESGKIVVLALYDGKKLAEVKLAIYDGTEVIFNTTKSYTDAKVMVWNNSAALSPLGSTEVIK